MQKIYSIFPYCYSLLILILIKACAPSGPEVNIYSSRHYEIDDQIFAKFTEKTGIQVNIIKANADQLMRRIELEGTHSPADLFMTADAGRLSLASKNELLQSIPESVYFNRLSSNLHDPEGNWLAFTTRTRVIMYNKVKVDSNALRNYEDLINPKFEGKILVRPAENVYNQSLLASIIIHHDREFAQKWAAGVVNNMARSPRGNDTDQIKGIAAGTGDIAIANSYYLAKLHNSPNPEEQRLAQRIGIIFPNQHSSGTHMNVSAVGLVKHAPNKENAIKLIDFLLSDEVQSLFMTENFEYPASKKVQIKGFLEKWEPFKRDTLQLSNLATYQQEASRIIYESGWR